jgi:hypothetical protein
LQKLRCGMLRITREPKKHFRCGTSGAEPTTVNIAATSDGVSRDKNQ